jgi:CHAD domain-containing protein
MTAKKGAVGIGDYARAQARKRLDKLAAEVERAAAEPNPDAIHDLRVSIRRFGQSLRIFGRFFPAGKRKRARKRMKKAMDLAAEIRDRDIAVELLAKAGLAEAEAAKMLAEERGRAGEALVQAVQRWQGKDFARKWGAQLELGDA